MADKIQKISRTHTKVWDDFLRMPPDVLSHFDKMVFIAIKSHAGKTTLPFPSINTLHRETGISRQWIQKSINHLEELGFLKKEKRRTKHEGNTSNLYYLNDTEEMCKASSPEEAKEISERRIPGSNQDLINELKRRGLTEEDLLALIHGERAEGGGKEKEPSDVGAADSSINRIIEFSNNDSNLSHEKLQGGNNRYSLADIREMMDYDHMIAEEPANNSLIDTAIEVIRDVLNTSRQTLRVGQEEVPASEVKARLLSLNHIMIMQCIDSIVEQSERGEPPRNIQSYLLTTLYRARSQDAKSDLQARHDMMHWSEVRQKNQIKKKPDDDWYNNC